MDERRRAFLAGERPGDVLMYLSETAVDDVEPLAEQEGGERVDGGAVVVVDGERGRQAFAAAAGTDPMSFAGRARGREGRIDPGLTGGGCPDDPATAVGDGAGGDESEEAADGDTDEDEPHNLRFLFSFVEAHQPDGDGLYAEGDVVHAYAQCSCGVAYSDRWVADPDAVGE